MTRLDKKAGGEMLSEELQDSDITLSRVFSESNKHSLVYRVFRLLRVRLMMLALVFRNRLGKSPVTGSAHAVVSLTTFGRRLYSVFYTIESIASGEESPQRLILWLDEEMQDRPLPASLVRLRNRGLEIRYTPDYRSHKKYFPYVMSDDHDFSTPLATADDDIIYPRHWLSRLVSAYSMDSQSIWAYRAHTIKLDENGILPYLQWTPCRSSNPSFSSFATGVSGVIYPPKMLRELRKAGDHFLTQASQADDVWLHAVAVRSRIRVGQVSPTSVHFDVVRGSWEGGLVTSNLSGGNDEQIRMTYNVDDIRVIREDSTKS
ncbi:MAG: hypothetical protein ABS910_02800 [Arthrobacter sp.]